MRLKSEHKLIAIGRVRARSSTWHIKHNGGSGLSQRGYYVGQASRDQCVATLMIELHEQAEAHEHHLSTYSSSK